MGKVFKVLFCCGSRPELIKIYPVYNKIKSVKDIAAMLCVTGQQNDLLTDLLDHLKSTPDFKLNVMRKGQNLEQLMEQLCVQLPDVFDQSQPDIVIVQGDTASALAAALIAQKKGYFIAHIEAGLRTYNINAPFPEEIYRQNISNLATWHFCPTETARENLLRENIPAQNIFVTGNTSVDMVLKALHESNMKDHRPVAFQRGTSRPYFLITLHRRESQGAPLMRIIDSLLIFAQSRPEFDYIIPLHPNPTTSDMIRSKLGHKDNISLIPAQSYQGFVELMARAFAIVTDSGGIQEEAPSLNIPVIVVRDNTERNEGIESGCLRLAGTERDNILYELNLLIDNKAHYKRMQKAANPFGDGFAADRITAHLIEILTCPNSILERNNQPYAKSE